MSLGLYEKLPDGLREYQSRFLRIADEFGQRHGLPAYPGGGQGAAFEFDSVAMSLRHDPFRMPFHVVAVVDFGPLPARDPQACRALLEANFLDAQSGALYAVAPETGHAVWLVPIALDGLDVDGLEAALRGLAAASRGAAV
jgi:hypothetical protein